MSEITVATRYAKSLIDLAKEQNSLEAVRGDMGFFAQTLRANTELQAVLRNPIISHDKKKSILDAIFGDKVNKATIGFFHIMINKSRSELLYPTSLEFVNQYDVIKNIVRASVVSAVPLSAENRAQIITEVNQIAEGEVELVEKVDPKIIGGFILTVGDRQIDASVSGSLTRLKKDFTQGVINN